MTDAEKVYKTTPEDFQFFQEKCHYWLSKLELNEWRIYFKHEKHPAEEGTKACVEWNLSGLAATIYLSPEWGDIEPTNAELSRTALHEIPHLLLATLRGLATTRHAVSLSDIEWEIHRTIRKLEHVLYGEQTDLTTRIMIPLEEPKDLVR